MCSLQPHEPKMWRENLEKQNNRVVILKIICLLDKNVNLNLRSKEVCGIAYMFPFIMVIDD